MVQRDLQQDDLHRDHDDRLDEERIVVFRAGVVEYPAARGRVSRCPSAEEPKQQRQTYLSSEATSIMSGISREKPALDLVRCIE